MRVGGRGVVIGAAVGVGARAPAVAVDADAGVGVDFDVVALWDRLVGFVVFFAVREGAEIAFGGGVRAGFFRTHPAPPAISSTISTVKTIHFRFIVHLSVKISPEEPPLQPGGE